MGEIKTSLLTLLNSSSTLSKFSEKSSSFSCKRMKGIIRRDSVKMETTETRRIIFGHHLFSFIYLTTTYHIFYLISIANYFCIKLRESIIKFFDLIPRFNSVQCNIEYF